MYSRYLKYSFRYKQLKRGKNNKYIHHFNHVLLTYRSFNMYGRSLKIGMRIII